MTAPRRPRVVSEEDVAAALDPERFAELRADYGPAVTGLVELFLEITPPTVEALGRALTARDAGALRAEAHKLRGGCLAVGALQLASGAGELEALARAGELELLETTQALAVVRRRWQALEVALRRATA